VFDKFGMGFLPKWNKNNLDSFSPGELHGRNEIGISGNQGNAVHNATTCQPGHIETDFDVDPLLPDLGLHYMVHNCRQRALLLRGKFFWVKDSFVRQVGKIKPYIYLKHLSIFAQP